MLVLNSDITIGKFHFSGVHEVVINRSLHSVVDTARIKIPSIAKVISGGKVSASGVITGKQFADGDPLTIKLGYNGDYKEEFSGFVRKRSLDMPLEVECEGYSWLLRRNSVGGFWDSIKVKDLLETAVSGLPGGYKIDVQCTVDHELSNVFLNGNTGLDVINTIRKYTDDSLCCFFISPTVLWCGLIYTAYANGDDLLNKGIVQYRLGYNVPQGNDLKERMENDDPTQVTYYKKKSDGNIIAQTSTAFKKTSRLHNRVLNQISDGDALKQLVNEKAYQLNYAGYEGSIQTFLQPYCTPGNQAYISDSRYPERNGNYLVESVSVLFGVRGAKRLVELGPRLGFNK